MLDAWPYLVPFLQVMKLRLRKPQDLEEEGEGKMYGESNVETYIQFGQSCLTLCDPMDYTVHGILQARILEWAACPFSRGSSLPRD